MTAEENPFVSDTSSLQSQLKGSYLSFCFFFCSSILLSNLLDVEVVLLSFKSTLQKKRKSFWLLKLKLRL